MIEKDIIIIAHNLRSCHNVGSLLRTAEGLGVSIILTGYTPHPAVPNENRMPHEIDKISKRISKTSLGAEVSANWQYLESLTDVMKQLIDQGYTIYALEQTDSAIALPQVTVGNKTAIIVGREVEGIEPEILKLVPDHLYIPMFGSKESFNVVQAAAMALYHMRFMP